VTNKVCTQGQKRIIHAHTQSQQQQQQQQQPSLSTAAIKQ
jgi:hypothetical protein